MAIKLTTSNGNRNEEREPTEYWLNAGVDDVHPDTGELEFFGMPLGIPLDPKSRMKGNSSLARTKNAIFDAIYDLTDGMEPGEERVIEGLTLKIRRIAEPSTEVANTPLSKALSGIKVA